MAAVLNSQLNTPFKLQNNVFLLLRHYIDKEFIDQIMLSRVRTYYVGTTNIILLVSFMLLINFVQRTIISCYLYNQSAKKS